MTFPAASLSFWLFSFSFRQLFWGERRDAAPNSGVPLSRAAPLQGSHRLTNNRPAFTQVMPKQEQPGAVAACTRRAETVTPLGAVHPAPPPPAAIPPVPFLNTG